MRNGKPEGMTPTHVIGNRLLALFTRFLLARTIKNGGPTDITTGSHGFRRGIIERLDPCSEGMDFDLQNTMKSLIRFQKQSNLIRVLEIPIGYNVRFGEAKLNGFQDGLKMFAKLIKLRIIGK